MANRFQNPRTQYFANPVTGAPLSGGQLFFYANGTVTPQNTYSDTALTIANSNPVVLNSAGFPGVDIFLQNLSYTVVLQDANNITLWSANNVYASDFSTVAVFGSFAGNPNGFVAGTAGSGTTSASSIWDYVNSVLYVCTATGNAAGAVWAGINLTTATSVVTPPQGYLTLVSATPVILADTSSTNIFYTPFVGALCPIWNGASYTNSQFSELTLALTAGNNIASSIYDVFIFNNSGVITIGTGPAWTTITAGAGARGSGAGTTQLSRLNGFYTNTNLITLKNGATTYTGIAANQATYVGSIFIDTTPGQVTCHTGYGQSRKWGVWNAYNRQTIYMKMGDPTSSWAYTGGVARAANGNAANNLTVFCGLPEERIVMQENQLSDINGSMTSGATTSFTGSYTGVALNGFGFNSTTAITGTIGEHEFAWSFALNVDASSLIGMGSNAPTFLVQLIANANLQPFIGINVMTALERGTITAAGNGSVSILFFGSETDMLVSATYRG